MNPDDLESLLRKARKTEPPAALKQRILQQAAAAPIPFTAPERTRRFSPWWGLIAAGWVLILTLWNTTPTPRPQPSSTALVPPSTGYPTLWLEIHAPELLAELGLALDSTQLPTPLPQHSSHL